VSTDTKAIIGTIVGTGLVLGGLLATQISTGNASLNIRIDDLRDDLRELRADTREDHARFDTRLDAVEVELGKVGQRLLTIERVVLPGPDADESGRLRITTAASPRTPGRPRPCRRR